VGDGRGDRTFITLDLCGPAKKLDGSQKPESKNCEGKILMPAFKIALPRKGIRGGSTSGAAEGEYDQDTRKRESGSKNGLGEKAKSHTAIVRTLAGRKELRLKEKNHVSPYGVFKSFCQETSREHQKKKREFSGPSKRDVWEENGRKSSKEGDLFSAQRSDAASLRLGKMLLIGEESRFEKGRGSVNVEG